MLFFKRISVKYQDFVRIFGIAILVSSLCHCDYTSGSEDEFDVYEPEDLEDEFESHYSPNASITLYPHRGDIPLLNRKAYKSVYTTVNEHPYMASVRRNFSHYLTASLITKNMVITVAHGVYRVPIYELGVVLGETYNDRGTMIRTVLVIMIHPDYDPNTLANDISIHRFYEDLGHSMDKTNIKPIAFSPRMHPETELRLARTRHYFATGWTRCDWSGKELCLPRGSLFFPNERMDPILKTVNFTDPIGLIPGDNPLCKGYEMHGLTLHPGMMCRGKFYEESILNRRSCLAVPGAPLVMNASLVGILSWGFGCGYYRDLPLIYSNISYYLPWLESVVSDAYTLLPMENLRELYLVTMTLMQLENHQISTRPQRQPEETEWENTQSDNIGSPDSNLIWHPYDKILGTINAKIYDIRDFLYGRKFSYEKQTLYNDLYLKRLRLPTTTTTTAAPTVGTLNTELFDDDDSDREQEPPDEDDYHYDENGEVKQDGLSTSETEETPDGNYWESD